MALMTNIIMLAGAVISALCGISTDYALAATEVTNMQVWDRVSVKEESNLYANSLRENEESVPPVPRWTFARFLERANNGTEKLQFADGSIWWVDRDNFWPVYQATGEQPVEIVGVFAKAGYEKAKKNEPEKLELKHIGWIEPGQHVAVERSAQALLNTYLIQTENKVIGYADGQFLQPVGDAGER
jgi:hypothetical protein